MVRSGYTVVAWLRRMGMCQAEVKKVGRRKQKASDMIVSALWASLVSLAMSLEPSASPD